MRYLPWILAVSVLAQSAADAGKTVHVKGYTRKDGTYVSPHTRSAPGSGYSAPVYYEPPIYRTSVKTEPRTTYRTGSYEGPAEAAALHEKLTPVSVESLQRKAAAAALAARLAAESEERQAKAEADRQAKAEKEARIGELLSAGREREAATLLRLANRIIANGDAAFGFRRLHELVEKYPETEAAREAVELLRVRTKS